MSTMIAAQTQENHETREMGTKPALARAFSVGDWHVEPQLNRIQLRDGSKERQLEPRLIKLLCFLAANSERVLSREELVQELWPRVVVNENSLTRAISELRKHLQPAHAARNKAYIETIPKRGYRILQPVALAETDSGVSTTGRRPRWTETFAMPSLRYGAAISAACLCLLVAAWLSLDTALDLQQSPSPALLSDELLDADTDYLGGELQLSTLGNNAAVVESIAAPVVSKDEKQYAFIQYDTNGSTIFLGGLGTAVEPVPVYFSTQHLFNLAWSPVGNNLLFGMKPSIATAAVYSNVDETAALITLNLNTLETSRLVEDINPAEVNSNNGLNLS
ncbi:MAG: hypothetical protein DHS20C12_05300 [Pseudohongiella sp.]|nr:MAG: hypothetical protein DHS20C12_05300 [Pseudohongiella sp.]